MFAEDCFKGGVISSGVDNIGSKSNVKAKIKWEDDYDLLRVYALTYRYGRPPNHTMYINNSPINWTLENQAGPEQIEDNDLTDFFATHANEISESVTIDNDSLTFTFPEQPFDGNKGWWGVYIIVHYDAPHIEKNVCSRIYVADQNQMYPQNYQIDKPFYDNDELVIFAIHSSRMASGYFDASRLRIDGAQVGDFWGGDLVIPTSSSGTHGHFYYEDGFCEGLNGDTANASISHHDCTAVVNDYMAAS
ncbi:MAG: hypothetical protein LC670_13475, partial [Flavobacteriales bacterium]|nr:hypothetical protein [Flavobacteriales bacterium]